MQGNSCTAASMQCCLVCATPPYSHSATPDPSSTGAAFKWPSPTKPFCTVLRRPTYSFFPSLWGNALGGGRHNSVELRKGKFWNRFSLDVLLHQHGFLPLQTFSGIFLIFIFFFKLQREGGKEGHLKEISYSLRIEK